MSSRTSCMRPPVMMSPPKANTLSTGSPEPQSSPTMGEPEIKSISFQESLRFFQEQFVKSTASSKSTNLQPLKIRLRPVLTKNEQQRKAEVDKISVVENDGLRTNYTSSEIPPIPTVETILESVRILRAIQRSQAQGGAIWTLECDDASLNCDISQLDSILTLDSSLNENGTSDLQVNFSQCGGHPSIDNNVTETNGISDSVNGSDNIISGLNKEEFETKVNNICAFWPKAVVDMVKQNVDLNNLMLLGDNRNDLNATSLSKNIAEDMRNKVNATVTERMNISLTPDMNGTNAVLKDSSLPEISEKDNSDGPNCEMESMDSCLCNVSVSSSYKSYHSKSYGILADDLVDDFVSCSSALAAGDRSPSVLDSGVATDKSLDSCSPTSALSNFADTEGGSSWTESSHYDSAEGTPFASFSDIAIAQPLPDDFTCPPANDTKIGTKNINNVRQESPVSDSLCDDQISGMGEGNLDDTDVDFDTCNSSLCETDNAGSPELSERDIFVCSPYQQDINISPKLSEGLQKERLLDITEDHPKSLEDIQRDRLLEVVEDSVHRVEYIPVHINTTQFENIAGDIKQSLASEPQSVEDNIHESECIPVQVNAAVYENLVNNYQQCQDSKTTEVQKLTSENSKNQSGDAVLKNDMCSSSVVVNRESANDVIEVNDAGLSDVQLSSALSGMESERPHIECGDEKHSGDAVVSKSDEVIWESQVCVSKIECTLTRANSSVVDTEDGGQTLDERPKKAPSLSWDPVLLLQHLYKLDQDSFYQHIHQSDEKHCGMLNVLPIGTFSEIGGQYYVVLEKNYFYCFKSSEEEEPLFCIPLQYATVEVLSKQVLVLDNRQGRYIHLKFESESHLDEWCATLESHCAPYLSSEYLEPVHYPLKCHKDVIIVDLGSCSTRAGILMDQPTLPQIYFPTVCASDKKTNQQLYGLEALFPEVRQNSVLSFPVRTSAKVTKFTMDIEALKGLFEKIFHDLGVDPSAFTLEICIPRALSTQTQVALVKLLLEDLRVKSVSLTRQALLTLYAHNTSTGIVIDIGDRMDILPVVDGFILETGVSRLPYGGQRIIHHLKHALAEKHISLSNEVESYLVQYILENMCYIAQDYEKELQYSASFPESVKKSMPLHPFFQGDNTLLNVSLDIGRFQVPEGLFNPDLWGLDSPGLHKLVHQAIQSSGVDVRRHITESIYVSGGVTLLPGFVERLEAEISKLTLPRLKPQIHASPYRNHMAYLGACRLAASDAFPQVCVTSKEWSDLGPRCLKKWHL